MIGVQGCRPTHMETFVFEKVYLDDAVVKIPYRDVILPLPLPPSPTDVAAAPKAAGYCVLLAGAYLADYASECIYKAVAAYLARKAFEKKVKEECIKECSDSVLEHPKHRDNFPDFRRCVRECCARSGVTY